MSLPPKLFDQYKKLAPMFALAALLGGCDGVGHSELGSITRLACDGVSIDTDSRTTTTHCELPKDSDLDVKSLKIAPEYNWLYGRCDIREIKKLDNGRQVAVLVCPMGSSNLSANTPNSANKLNREGQMGDKTWGDDSQSLYRFRGGSGSFEYGPSFGLDGW